MAINLMCMNDKCKYYWEDNCTRNLVEERIEINFAGECETFEEGRSDWYKESEVGESMIVKCDDKKCIYSENGACTNKSVIREASEEPSSFGFAWCLVKEEREGGEDESNERT